MSIWLPMLIASGIWLGAAYLVLRSVDRQFRTIDAGFAAILRDLDELEKILKE